MLPPVLARCTEPIVDRAPDLRGIWLVINVTSDHPAFDTARLADHVERIE